MTHFNKQKIHQGERSVLSRAVRAEDGRAVVLKELRGAYPLPATMARFRREYEIQRAAGCPYVVEALRFAIQEGVPLIEMEDCGSTSLNVLFREHRPTLQSALEIGTAAAHALHHLHELGVVHKDATPANIVLNRETGTVKLIDFGISSVVRRERGGTSSFEGTPAFMAPEQTGRMNRGIDHRADLYTLGATLYWLLCHRPPFPSMDPLELVHAQIARTPPQPTEVDPSIPPVVSQIVMGLLAKRPEDRYQSAAGVAHDLSRCVDELMASGHVARFEPNLRQFGQSLIIPERLYGRESEMARLGRAFATACAGGFETLFISGDPGVGKTALVGELHQIASATGATFLSAKVNQFGQDQPYNAIRTLYADYVERVLAQDDEALAEATQRLATAVGEHGDALLELVPNAALLLGAATPQPALSPVEAENRTRRVLIAALGAMATPGQPLVLFLDDLQWSDAGSLRLLESLLLDTSLGFTLVVGAYRADEVVSSHPLATALARTRKLGVVPTTLRLTALGPESVVALVRETVGRDDPEMAELAQLVHDKTQGNPFYVHRFLESLASEGLLHVDTDTTAWVWEADQIRARAHTENVVSYMLTHLDALPQRSVEALAIAARAGTTFPVSLVAAVCGWSRAQTLQALTPALHAGLIAPRDEGYYFNGGLDQTDEQIPDFVLGFSHDRVQTAAATALVGERLAQSRWKMGQHLLDELDEQALDARLFEVVQHLNAGLGAGAEHDDVAIQRLIALNTRAGLRALRCAAYDLAHSYLTQSLQLLPDSSWETDYRQTLDLHVAAAEASYLSSNHDAMEARVSAIERRATDLLDQTRGREIRVRAFVSRNEHLDGVAAALATLKVLGVSLPTAPTGDDVAAAAGVVVEAVMTLGVDALIAVPEVTNPATRASRRILVGITSAAYVSTPNLLPLIAFELVGSTIRDGASKESPYGLVVLALALAAGGHFDLSYSIGKAATAMLGRWPDASLHTRVLHIWNTHTRAFKDPYSVSADALARVYELGVQSGDLEYACWAGHNQGIMNLYSGRPLAEVAEGMQVYGEGIDRFQQEAARECHRPFVRWVACLRGRSENPARLDGASYAEAETWESLAAIGFRGALFLTTLARMAVRFLFGQPEQALSIADEGEAYQDGAVATVHLPIFLFYDALAAIATTRLAPDRRAALTARAQGRLGQLLPFAEAAPDNHGHRVALLEAELLGVQGDTLGAMERYDDAIRAARSVASTGDEALANELAGRFHRRESRTTISRGYLMEAHYGWQNWGAAAMAQQLESEFDDLLTSGYRRAIRPRLGDVTFGGATTTAGETNAGLDIETLARTHQALSRHTRLSSVLDTIVRVLVQNAGATRGFLVLENAARVHVIAASEDAEGAPVLDGDTPLRAQSVLPVRIVQFVARTGERIILADATRDPRFEGDIRLRRATTLSVLCTPISHLGTTLGIIYLENDLASGAFDTARSQVVDLLGTQAAISIQNAQLVENLEGNVATRTKELEFANTELRTSLEKIRTMQKQIIVHEKLASLGSLTAGIAHELRNPLNFINNFSAVAMELVDELAEITSAETGQAAGPDDVRELLDDLRLNSSKIHDHGTRASNIIRNMLDHAGKSSTDRESVAINDLLMRAAKLGVDGSAKQIDGPVAVRHELDPDAGNIVLSRSDLQRVVINIVDNACYAMNEKRRSRGDDFEPALWLFTRREADWLVIRIRDNGTGMSREVQANVFNPFFTTKPAGQGTGLGLSLSYDIIVNGHQGELSVDTSLDEYTEFTLHLPTRIPDGFAD